MASSPLIQAEAEEWVVPGSARQCRRKPLENPTEIQQTYGDLMVVKWWYNLMVTTI